MRNIILISAACELVVVAAAIFAGAPVVDLLRASARRVANATVVCAVALVCWISAGQAINGLVARLPDGGRFAAALVRIGDVEFNLVIMAPMLLVTLALAYALTMALVAAAMGRGLGDCARAALRGAPSLRSRAVLPTQLSER